MRILITGSTGFIGSALVPFLTNKGHTAVRLVRTKKSLEDFPATSAILWNPKEGEISPSELEGFDAVINFAGVSIFSSRWTKSRKREILESRTQSTKLLSNTLRNLSKPPKVLISSSAVGFYGDRGDEVLTEESGKGAQGFFLTEVCVQWEDATRAAEKGGIRTVNLRTGIVLNPGGGILGKTLTLFELGLGGKFGNGHQYFSWISMDDLLNVFLKVLNDEKLRGPVNAVSPNPVTNEVYTKTLGRVLSRPTFLTVPRFGARLILGEMADELLFASERVVPTKLLNSNHTFEYPVLENALRGLLKKSK